MKHSRYTQIYCRLQMVFLNSDARLWISEANHYREYHQISQPHTELKLNLNNRKMFKKKERQHIVNDR